MLRRKSGMGSNSDSGVGDEIANADSGSLELGKASLNQLVTVRP